MPVYVSLLRGVNLGAHHRMKMEDLQKSVEALGLEQVQTYIQSGNVVFVGAKQSTSNLSERIREKILADFAYTVPVITKTADEMESAVRHNSFLKEKWADVSKLHVSFLWETPTTSAMRKLEALPVRPEQCRHVGKEIYLYCPNGYGNCKLSNNILERVLAVGVTTRNWKTVNHLSQMVRDYK